MPDNTPLQPPEERAASRGASPRSTPSARRRAPPRIGFLLNHYEPHQVPHVAPIACALSRLRAGWHVEILCSTPAEAAFAADIAALYPGQRTVISRLDVPLHARLVDPLVRHVAFYRKLAVQRANTALLARFDALVVPEVTSLSLRDDPRFAGVRFIFTGHGAGDGYGRSVGMFDPRIDRFDLVLLPGPRIAEELAALGRFRHARRAIVGYPKLEIAALSARRDLFGNGRPTVLYNPTQTRTASSWFRFGPQVLDFFRRSDAYNLIFAPHVLLFKRSLTRGARLPRRFRSTATMLIDTGSRASVDLSYLEAADIYLGDLSSQVYEFINRPRPCVFLDPFGDEDRDATAFPSWSFGPVVRDAGALGDALRRSVDEFPRYRPVQEAARDRNIAPSPVPASTRAATAIAAFVETGEATEVA